MGSSTDPELLAEAVYNPGRLVIGPTATVGGFPYGGIEAGFTEHMECRPSVEYQRNKDPSNGELNEIARRSVENMALGCILTGVRWDEDLLQAIFLRTVQAGLLPFPSPGETQIIGGAKIPRVVKALPPTMFVPEAAAGECVYFIRPLLLLDLRDGIKFSSERRCGMPVVFVASAALNRDPWQISRLEQITL